MLWRLNEHIEDLDYADDIVLLSPNFRDLQAKLNDFVEESQKVGLRVNSRTTEDFGIAEEEIERVDDFLYLGFKIVEDGKTLLDI